MANDSVQPTQPLASFVVGGDVADAPPIAVSRPVSRIGQGPQNDVVLDDDTVSTTHAQLELSPGGWLLTDLESRNGTYVDGVRLAPRVPTPLPSGATVTFGGFQLGFVAAEGIDAQSAREEFEAAARTATPPPRRAPLRLPVWLLALVIVFIALLVTLFLVFGGDPQVVEPVVDPTTAWLQPSAFARAA